MKYVLFLTIATLSPLFASLAPEHQAAREKESILNDPRFHELLGSQTVTEIVKSWDGYIVMTDQGGQIPVRVRYIPSKVLGPAQFELEFP